MVNISRFNYYLIFAFLLLSFSACNKDYSVRELGALYKDGEVTPFRVAHGSMYNYEYDDHGVLKSITPNYTEEDSVSLSVAPFVISINSKAGCTKLNFSFNGDGFVTRIESEWYDLNGKAAGEGQEVYDYDSKGHFLRREATYSFVNENGEVSKTESSVKLVWKEDLIVSARSVLKSAEINFEAETRFDYSDDDKYENSYNQFFGDWLRVRIEDDEQRENYYIVFVDFVCADLGAVGRGPKRLPKSSTTYFKDDDYTNKESFYYYRLRTSYLSDEKDSDLPCEGNGVDIVKLDNVRTKIDW